MNLPQKYILFAILALMTACSAMGQKFRSHAVKRGETLSSISRLYEVSVQDLYRYNKELEPGQPLRPNTILVIPVSSSEVNAQSPANGEVRNTGVRPVRVVDTTRQSEPIRFETHRVRRKETLFGITQRYDIEESELKRFNPDLYSKPLQKGMVLRIPVFPEGYRETQELEAQLTSYTVQPKETRWSIAHQFGISMDSLLSLNPELPRSTSYLAVGQELRVPVLPGAGLPEQETQLYESYTVPPQKTLFSLSQEYEISREEIIRLNPQIMEAGGLKEGMVLRLPPKPEILPSEGSSDFLFYEVKPKQTEFSLTRKFGIGWAEMVALNPELSSGLKAGMVLKIPIERAPGLEVKNEVILDQFDLRDSINPLNVPRLLVLFPFRLDRLDLSEEERTREQIARNNALKYSLGLYSGMMVALDSLADLGISTEIVARDTRLKPDHVRTLILNEDLERLSAIIGPLESESIREVAARASGLNVPVIAPVPVNLVVPEENIFHTYTKPEVSRRQMLDYAEKTRTDEKILIISDQDNAQAELSIMERFPGSELVELREEEENIALDVEALKLQLSEEVENWIFVETDNFKIASSVVSILNSSNSDTTRIRMLTTNQNRIYDNEVISATHLSNLRFTFPSVYRDRMDPGFVRKYRQRYGGPPDRYAARGYDLTMDLVLRLAYKPDLFQVADQLGETRYSANKFNYVKPLQSGYYNTSAYILMYDGLRIKEAEDP